MITHAKKYYIQEFLQFFQGEVLIAEADYIQL